MIQFDDCAKVSNGLVKNHQRDNELLVAIISLMLSGVTLILIGSGSEIFGKKKDLPILTPRSLTGRCCKMMVGRLPSFGKANVQRRTVRLPGSMTNFFSLNKNVVDQLDLERNWKLMMKLGFTFMVYPWKGLMNSYNTGSTTIGIQS